MHRRIGLSAAIGVQNTGNHLNHVAVVCLVPFENGALIKRTARNEMLRGYFDRKLSLEHTRIHTTDRVHYPDR